MVRGGNWVTMSLEYIGKSMVISCDACRATCIVASEEAFTVPKHRGDEHVAIAREAAKEIIPGRAYIVVREGRVDHRHRRQDGAGIRLGTEIVMIREYPYLCDDCYETGGYDELGANGWDRMHQQLCRECGSLFADESPERTQCHTCRARATTKKR